MGQLRHPGPLLTLSQGRGRGLRLSPGLDCPQKPADRLHPGKEEAGGRAGQLVHLRVTVEGGGLLLDQDLELGEAEHRVLGVIVRPDPEAGDLASEVAIREAGGPGQLGVRALDTHVQQAEAAGQLAAPVTVFQNNSAVLGLDLGGLGDKCGVLGK